MASRQVCGCAVIVGAILTAALPARAELYRWEWTNPADTSDPLGGRQASTTVLSPTTPGQLQTWDGLSLQQAWFRDANVRFSSFASADLRDADFARAGAAYAQFPGANIADGFFAQANLQGATFSNATLPRAVFTGATLQETSFQGAVMPNAKFAGTPVPGTDFSNADLTGSDFSASTVVGSKFISAKLDNASFAGATLDEWNFSHGVSGTVDFGGASLRNANFDNAYLRGVAFSGTGEVGQSVNADLTGATFRGATLEFEYSGGETTARGADFTNATFTNSGFWGWDLAGAKFVNASFDNQVIAFSSLQDVDFTGMSIQGGQLDLTNSDLRGATGFTAGPTQMMTSMTILPDGTISNSGGGNGLWVRPHAITARTDSLVLPEGWLLIDGGGRLNVATTVETSGDSRILVLGDLEVGTSLTIGAGGSLWGSGPITTPLLLNHGVVSPGNLVGPMSITGDLRNEGSILFHIAGTEAGQFGQLIVDGDILAGGTIALESIEGYAPAPGDQFRLLSWTGSLTDEFTFDFSLLNLPDGWHMDPTIDANGLTLTVSVPEPVSGIAIFLAGACAMLRRNRAA